MKDFAVFILSNGRAGNIKTLKLLKRSGYTGRVYIVIDDEDTEKELYLKEFGDLVVVFSKEEISERFDECDNFKKRGSVFYARNACFDIAERLGLKWFVQLDDDYHSFGYRFDEDLNYKWRKITKIDDVFSTMVNFLETTKCKMFAMAQGGDFIGGGLSGFGDRVCLKRKAMNSLFCKTDNRVIFQGKLNEDVNTYILGGLRGDLIFTTNLVSLTQERTQNSKGGMTELYNNVGTYVKSFYSVMCAPACVKISVIRDKDVRIHHKINWNNTAVKILRNER